MRYSHVTIKGEKAAYMDIKSAVSLTGYGSGIERDAPLMMDEQVRRVMRYSEVVYLNLVKRAVSYIGAPSENRLTREEVLHAVLRNRLHLTLRDRVYYIDPNEKKEIPPVPAEHDQKKVRGYTEYVLHSIITHYFHYNRN